jgi:hypothetical protein
LNFSGLADFPANLYHGFMANPLPPGIPPEFWDDYRKRIEADIDEAKRDLAPLESGHMYLGERKGGEPWRDTTQEWIAQHKRTIAKYEAILAALKKGELL